MASVQEILDDLNKVSPDKRHLPVIAVHGASGVSYEVSVSSSVSHKNEWDDTGTLCDMKDGEEYVRGYLD